MMINIAFYNDDSIGKGYSTKPYHWGSSCPLDTFDRRRYKFFSVDIWLLNMFYAMNIETHLYTTCINNKVVKIESNSQGKEGGKGTGLQYCPPCEILVKCSP